MNLLLVMFASNMQQLTFNHMRGLHFITTLKISTSSVQHGQSPMRVISLSRVLELSQFLRQRIQKTQSGSMRNSKATALPQSCLEHLKLISLLSVQEKLVVLRVILSTRISLTRASGVRSKLCKMNSLQYYSTAYRSSLLMRHLHFQVIPL